MLFLCLFICSLSTKLCEKCATKLTITVHFHLVRDMKADVVSIVKFKCEVKTSADDAAMLSLCLW